MGNPNKMKQWFQYEAEITHHARLSDRRLLPFTVQEQNTTFCEYVDDTIAQPGFAPHIKSMEAVMQTAQALIEARAAASASANVAAASSALVHHVESLEEMQLLSSQERRLVTVDPFANEAPEIKAMLVARRAWQNDLPGDIKTLDES